MGRNRIASTEKGGFQSPAGLPGRFTDFTVSMLLPERPVAGRRAGLWSEVLMSLVGPIKSLALLMLPATRRRDGQWPGQVQIAAGAEPALG